VIFDRPLAGFIDESPETVFSSSGQPVGEGADRLVRRLND
jgi:hypothetical protein